MENNSKDKFEQWLFTTLHSPGAFDDKTAQQCFLNDFNEAQALLKEFSNIKQSMPTFKTFDDLELRFWLLEKQENKKIKILLHGSGSNFCKAKRAIFLLERGFNVAMISYRGHSGNSGKASQELIINDVKAAINCIKHHGYANAQMCFEASSLGTCVLAHVLTDLQEKNNDCFASLILKAAPLNLMHQDSFISLENYGLHLAQAKNFLEKIWNQELIYKKLKVQKILLVHGVDDLVVPVEDSKKICALLKPNNPNLELKLIENAGHRLQLEDYDLY
jgi:dipeptidyl aminopeptidase/acylaminoacyl peptidase